jgi:hypothetical protein
LATARPLVQGDESQAWPQRIGIVIASALEPYTLEVWRYPEQPLNQLTGHSASSIRWCYAEVNDGGSIRCLPVKEVAGQRSVARNGAKDLAA